MLVTSADTEVPLKSFPGFVSEREGALPPTLPKHQKYVQAEVDVRRL
jgi:hypothetical protein